MVICYLFRIFGYIKFKTTIKTNKTMAQNIPTTTEGLEIYLQNQIRQTDGHIIRITQHIITLEKDFEEAQSSEARMEWARLIDNERLSLENYEFRLDWLQTRLEELQTLINL